MPAPTRRPQHPPAVFVVETTLVLPQPAASIFAVAGSLVQAPRWRAGVADVRDDARNDAAHARSACVLAFRALGARWAMPTREIAWEPPHHAVWRSRGAAFSLDLALTLEPVPGGTRVTYHCGLALASAEAMPPERATALRRLLVRRAPRDLERLRALVAGASAALATA